ncbi:Oviduct-specific glycoprotein [Myotis brandtii]|uniref:Oviduct-specific glycoprotein n=1 Tax=Myotis brandtii TaxID=109478 RepID=S7MIM1_MYOBR|nr:Oviduct-specific glycoprotein [Myotis brandtii]
MGRLLLWVGAAHKLVCYFTDWAHNRPGPASVLPSDLDPFLCTHLIFAFASMNDNQMVAKDLQDEEILYPEFNKLKERFTTMLSTSATRKKFISSAISLLRTHNFDGLDLCFLYPGLRGSPMYDRWNFLFLIQELLLAFQQETQLTMCPRLLLSAAVSGDPQIIQTAYDVPHLGRRVGAASGGRTLKLAQTVYTFPPPALYRLLDFINVLTFDIHGSWEEFTGHNSPLFSQQGDPGSVAYAMDYWRKLGAPSEKLLMGFPTYGRTFHLLKDSEHWLQAQAVGPASPGKYTRQPGFLAYYEGAKKCWIEHQRVPYAYKGEEWVGYDDAISFRHKASFIKKEHYGGAMIWTLDLDDVRGTFCATGPFPLVSVLKNLLLQAESSSTLSPKFWPSYAMNSSSTGPGGLTVTKALPTVSGILLSGGEGVATETQRKTENMTTIPRGGIVTPTRGAASFVKHTVVLQGKTETPGEKTMTPVTPEQMTMTSGHLETETSGVKNMVRRRKAVAPAKMIIPSGKMTVTPDGKTKTLRGEHLTSEVDTDP